MMKRLQHFAGIIFFLFISLSAAAGEGMWLPQLLAQLNEKEMKSMGMKISAEDIYSVNKGSLKDAIVSFGGFCTGEIISSQGLVLTNHHCGYSAIQSHSSVESNYLRDGFWAGTKAEELSNPSLFVTFVVRIEDVTDIMLKGVDVMLSGAEREARVQQNVQAVRNTIKIEEGQDAVVRSFFEGNKYYAIVTETFRDVRLVGAPPSSIGKFGADTDNWMWPRHTGDFALFRIYADKNNRPAAYSPDNVPYKPKKHLKISLEGVERNDFTMVFGFPGRTMQYLPSFAVQQIKDESDPAKVALRDEILRVQKEFMMADEKVDIAYASKFASTSNAWKKWQGEILGLNASNAVAQKQAYEKTFTDRINAQNQYASYRDILPKMQTLYAEFGQPALARDYYNEVMRGVEILNFANRLYAGYNSLKTGEASNAQRQIRNFLNTADDLYPDYHPEVDKAVFKAVMRLYADKLPAALVPATLQNLGNETAWNDYADQLYANSLFNEPDRLKALLNEASSNPAHVISTLENDPAFMLYNSIREAYQTRSEPDYTRLNSEIENLQRRYMAAQMDVFAKDKKFYPDANSTMRVTYGKVEPYEPRDGVRYEIVSYLDGVMEKYVPGDYEFDVPQKLIDLYKKKDYGQYGSNGKMPVCFIASNHTTGGNSGSPALDAHGNLIGLNFDRVWEGTMSDINYDPSICRNIMVDARYILFIIDKFAGAKHLIDEMELVKRK